MDRNFKWLSLIFKSHVTASLGRNILMWADCKQGEERAWNTGAWKGGTGEKLRGPWGKEKEKPTMVKVVEQRARQHFHSSPSNAGIWQDNHTTALAPQTFRGSPEQEVISLFLYLHPGAVGHAHLSLSALVPGLSQELSLSYLPEVINPYNNLMKLRWLSHFLRD